MTTRAWRSPIAIVMVFLGVLHVAPNLPAQTPVRVTIPGTSFSAEGAAGEVAVDNVAGGRRFRGKAFAKVLVRATLQMPPASSAEFKMQRLVIHFRTSQSGPSLRSVELRNGANSEFRLQTQVAGDYTAREVTTPESSANAWDWSRVPVKVSAQTVVRLEIQFPGGFDSQINPGEFVLTGVVVDFPRKAMPLPTTIPSTNAGTSAGAAVGGGVIYALSDKNELLWYRHTGVADGSFTWAFPEGKTVGTGWDFKQVFSGGDGVIYAITAAGELLWYRHDGRRDGSFAWAASAGKNVGTGWNFAHVFPGSGGVIYAITGSGELLWYRHDGRADGSMNWAASTGKQVGTGWNVKHAFSGGDGVIYVINANDELLWYRHDGRDDGTFRWAAAEGKRVGTGWAVRNVFPGANGVIYSVMPNGDLLWNRHDGRGDGSFRWAAPQGKKVGSGWAFKDLFSGDRPGS